MLKQIKYKVQSAGILIGLLVALSSCNSEKKQDVIEINNSGAQEENLVSISKSQFESSGMALGKISNQTFYTTVKANGMLDVPPENKASVSAYFAGYVKDLRLLPGDKVKKGQVLFTLENPNYIQMQQDYLEAKSKLDFLKSEYDRQKTLLAENITSKKSFLKAESDYRVTLAQYQSLEKKLRLMNINPSTLTGANLTSAIKVYAPISGIVTDIETAQGMFLNPSDVALIITDGSQLHLELKVFEKDLPSIKEEQPIKFHLQDSDSIYEGEVHLINKSINTRDRTINIHGDLIHMEDAKLFAPGMYIESDIITSSQKFDALPSEAIVNVENANYALLKTGATSYKKVLIQVGITSNGYTQVLNAKDFDADVQFVTMGAFNLITD
ncbi:efflux RND transporter periplasmic adaptor subunit [Gaetbulibacter aestuarii]|uniref:Efflux RND transporter periplasmic adaptor subunit n=1 Tax=Gaetbulibacter aestuarii TaxID=1502358 RepID=A0ABW7MWW7_9FLAO